MIFNYFRVPGAHFGDPGDFVYVIHYVILFAIFFIFSMLDIICLRCFVLFFIIVAITWSPRNLNP